MAVHDDRRQEGDSVRQEQTIGVAIERHRHSIRQRQRVRLIIDAEGLMCHMTNIDDMTMIKMEDGGCLINLYRFL